MDNNNENDKINAEQPQQSAEGNSYLESQQTANDKNAQQTTADIHTEQTTYNTGAQTQQAQQFVKQVGSQVESFTKNKELLEKVGLICACAGFLVSFIFTIVSCSKSASNSISTVGFKGSYLFLFVVAGMVISIAGGVMAFMSKRGEDFGMMAKITFLVVIVTLIFAIIPNVTICAYNNSLNNAMEKSLKDIWDKDYSSLWD